MLHIDGARRAWVGAGLLSVNLSVVVPSQPPNEIVLERIWSSDPKTYPVGGRKRKPATTWTRNLFVEKQVVQIEGDTAMAQTFDDFATMASLNLHSAINVPIVDNDVCIATFNLMGARSTWQPFHIAAMRLLALLAKPSITREAGKLPHAVAYGGSR